MLTKLLLLGLIFCHFQSLVLQDNSFIFLIPDRAEVQGKVILSYKRDGSEVTNQLSYSEVYDITSQRSKLTIGDVGYEPTTYHASAGSPTIRVSKQTCESFDSKLGLAPELLPYAGLMLPGLQLDTLYPFLLGPFGMSSMMTKVSQGSQYKLVGTVTRKNYPCDLYTKSYTVPGRDIKLDFEICMSSKQADEDHHHYILDYKRRTMLSARASGLQSYNKLGISEAGYVIEAYEIEEIDKDKIDQLARDLTVPLELGCSQFVNRIRPNVSHQTFSTIVNQYSSGKNYVLAYDRANNYLKKSTMGGPRIIWDINERLMYHINERVQTAIGTTYDDRMKLEPCSVLRVNTDYSAAFRPYNHVSTLLDVLEYLGAEYLSYMGRSRARDMETDVYETIVKKSPIVFGAFEGDETKPIGVEYDHIVQLHLAHSDSPTDLDESNFIPIRMKLFRRTRKQGISHITLMDVLEFHDFRWSLSGWERRPAETFLASECFQSDKETEQLELETSIVFDRIHKNVINEKDKDLLEHNKFRLEEYLIQSLLNYYDISRLHLVDYELELRKTHLELRLVIADRMRTRDLHYDDKALIGAGCEGRKGCYELLNVGEEECILTGSLMANVDNAAYCPSREGDINNMDDFNLGPKRHVTCMFFKDASAPPQPSHISNALTNPCKVYKFKDASPPRKGTSNLNFWLASLHDYKFNFQAKRAEAEYVPLRGTVAHYNIERNVPLLSVPGYKFKIGQADEAGTGVRVFKAYTHYNLGDCIRACNLNDDCKSYSFCPRNSLTDSNECALTSLDLRDEIVRNQLSKVSPGDPTVYEPLEKLGGKDLGGEYSVELDKYCQITERNYLDTFVQTPEIAQVPIKLASQISNATSVVACARRAIERPGAGSMFAYCAQRDTCILDESLFGKASEPIEEEDPVIGSGADQLVCTVYRRRYQTYFHVSAKILPAQEGQFKRIAETVEECARICWLELSDVCASFDYGSTVSECVINTRWSNATAPADFISKPNWLHYERDLGWDTRYYPHAGLPKHHLLNVVFDSYRVSNWGILQTFASLFLGLYLGLVLTRRLDGSNLISLYASTASSMWSYVPFPFRWANGRPEEAGGQMDTTHSIQLEDISKDTSLHDRQ